MALTNPRLCFQRPRGAFGVASFGATPLRRVQLFQSRPEGASLGKNRDCGRAGCITAVAIDCKVPTKCQDSEDNTNSAAPHNDDMPAHTAQTVDTQKTITTAAGRTKSHQRSGRALPAKEKQRMQRMSSKTTMQQYTSASA